MSNSIILLVGIDPSGLDTSFESTTLNGLHGRLYLNGILQSTSMTITPLISVPDSVELSGLPNVANGDHFAITYEVSALSSFVVYYPIIDGSTYTPTRIVQNPLASQDLTQLGITLIEDSVVSLTVPTLTEQPLGSRAFSEYVISGLPFTIARWSMSQVGSIFNSLISWEVELADVVAISSSKLQQSFLDMLPHNIGIQSGSTPKDGSEFVTSGSLVVAKGLVESMDQGGGNTEKNSAGRELAITHMVTLGGFFNLFVDNKRFILPDEFYSLSSDIGHSLEAKSINLVSDASGPCYEVVMFGLA